MPFDFSPPDYGHMLGLDNQPDPRVLAQNQQQIDLQRQQQQAQLAQQQQKLAQQQAYTADVADLLTNFTPEKAAAVMAKHPEQSQAIKSAFEQREKAAQDSDFKGITELYGLLGSGRIDDAKSRLQARIDAGKAHGIDVSDDEQLLAQVGHDPNQAQAFLGYVMASVGGADKFAAIQEQLRLAQGGDDKPFTLGAGEVRYDAHGNPIASSPYKPQVIGDAEHGYFEYTPGGDAPGSVTGKILSLEGTIPNPASSANGPGQFINSTFRQYIGAASPEVAQQIAGMSDSQLSAYRKAHAAELAPLQTRMTDALTAANQSALAAAKLPTTEGNTYMAHVFGAAGTVKALQAGPDARAALYVGGNKALTNNGLPGNATVGQVQAWASRKMASAGSAQGGSSVRQITPGAPDAKPARMTPQEVQAEGLDPKIIYYRDKSGIPQAVSGQTKQTSARQVPQQVINKLQPQIDIRDTLRRLNGSFKNDFGGNTVTGGIENTLQSIYSGFGTPGQRDWWADFQAMDNQVRNQLFGSALTEHEKKAYEETTISPRMDPKIIRQNLRRRLQIINGATARQQNFLKTNRYDPDAVDALFEPLSGVGGDAAPSGGWGKARRVQ